MTQFTQTIPVFRMFDEDKARQFYIDYLGFTLDWENRFESDAPLYMQLSRGNLTLHLSEHHGDGTPGSVAFVWVERIDDLHRELGEKKYKYLRPGIQTQPWRREMQLVDPFKNELRLCEKAGA